MINDAQPFKIISLNPKVGLTTITTPQIKQIAPITKFFLQGTVYFISKFSPNHAKLWVNPTLQITSLVET